MYLNPIIPSLLTSVEIPAQNHIDTRVLQEPSNNCGIKEPSLIKELYIIDIANLWSFMIIGSSGVTIMEVGQ